MWGAQAPVAPPLIRRCSESVFNLKFYILHVDLFRNASDKMAHLIGFLAFFFIRSKISIQNNQFKLNNDLRLYVTGSFNKTISVLDVAIL